MFKKIIATVAILTLVLSSAATAFAAPRAQEEPVESRTVVVQNAGFHCNGNVRPEFFYDRNGLNAQRNDVAVGLTEIIGTTSWELTAFAPWANRITYDELTQYDGHFECPNCGRSDWVSFSNNSGVPNGKNIRLTHPTFKLPERPPTPSTNFNVSLTFDKTVYGEPADVVMPAEFEGFRFEMFAYDAQDEVIATANSGAGGVVSFRDITLAPGRFVIREVLTVDYLNVAGIVDSWGYRLVWRAVYPGGGSGLFFTVTADGDVVWDVASPVVDNVFFCKHYLQWSTNLESAGGNPEPFEGGVLLRFGCPGEVYEFYDTGHTPPSCNSRGSFSLRCAHVTPEYHSNVFTLRYGAPTGHRWVTNEQNVCELNPTGLSIRRGNVNLATGIYTWEQQCVAIGCPARMNWSVFTRQLECGEVTIWDNTNPIGTIRLNPVWLCGTCDDCQYDSDESLLEVLLDELEEVLLGELEEVLL